MGVPHSTNNKATLRKLRDQLGIEVPRARTRPGAPPELVQRLTDAFETVSAVCLRPPPEPGESEVMQEVYEDALVEAHLVLHEWERWNGQRKEPPAKPKPRATVQPQRRGHERHQINVSVVLERHALSDSTQTTEPATMVRPARDVSLSGMFVTASKGDFPGVASGSVVHVSLLTSLGASLSLRARAVVTRRDESGFGLRWVQNSDETKRAIKALLDAVSRANV